MKAVKKNKAENKRKIDPTKILLNSVQENFEFPQELLNSLPDIDDVDYEDFETLNEQVESLDRIKRKRTWNNFDWHQHFVNAFIFNFNRLNRFLVVVNQNTAPVCFDNNIWVTCLSLVEYCEAESDTRVDGVGELIALVG